jgi:hypothetical protein
MSATAARNVQRDRMFPLHNVFDACIDEVQRVVSKPGPGGFAASEHMLTRNKPKENGGVRENRYISSLLKPQPPASLIAHLVKHCQLIVAGSPQVCRCIGRPLQFSVERYQPHVVRSFEA